MENENNFIEFLKLRYMPCILCIVSDRVYHECPDFGERLIKKWNDYCHDSDGIYIRIIFPLVLPTEDSLYNYFKNMKNICPSKHPYEFLNRIDPAEIDNVYIKELQKKVFEIDFGESKDLLCDNPLAFLFITWDKDEKIDVKSICDVLPNKIIDMLHGFKKMDKIPACDETVFQNELLRFYKIQKEKFRCEKNKIIDNFNHLPPTSNFKQIYKAKKELADLQMMIQSYQQASDLYDQIVRSFLLYMKQVNNQIISDIQEHNEHIVFLKFLNDYLSGKNADIVLKNVYNALKSTKNDVLYCKMVLFGYFLLQHSNFQIESISQYIIIPKQESLIAKIISPFIMEQKIKYLTKRKQTRQLIHISQKFNGIDYLQHSTRCLWNALSMICQNKGWELISQNLLEKIGNQLEDEKEILIDGSQSNNAVDLSIFIGRCLQSRYMYSLKTFEYFLNEFLKRVPLKHFRCPLVKCTINSFKSKGFPFSKPRNINYKLLSTQILQLSSVSNLWFMMCEKMFGSFYKGSFFKAENVKKYECSVGQKFTVYICIASYISGSPLNVSLRVKNLEVASDIYTIDNIETNKSYKIKLHCIPKESGVARICGICFSFGNIKNLKADFSNSHIELKVYKESPNIQINYLENLFQNDMYHQEKTMKVNSTKISKNLYVGETRIFSFHLKNIGLPLTHLSMIIVSDLKVILVDPTIEILLGKYILKPLNTNEELNIQIAVHAEKEGRFNSLLIFPYWSTNPPPKYNYIYMDFEVTRIKLNILDETSNGNYNNPNTINVIKQKHFFSIYSPPNFHIYGFTSLNFDPNLFFQIKDLVAVFDFISYDNNTKNLKFPKYINIFKQNTNLSIWLKNENSYVEFPIPLLIDFFNIILIIQRNKSDLFFTIKNVSSIILDNLFFSFLQEPSNGYIITGKHTVIIDEMNPNDEAKTKASFIRISDQNTKPELLIQIRNTQQKYLVKLDI